MKTEEQIIESGNFDDIKELAEANGVVTGENEFYYLGVKYLKKENDDI